MLHLNLLSLVTLQTYKGRAIHPNALIPVQHQSYYFVLLYLTIYKIVVHPSLIPVIEPPHSNLIFCFSVFSTLLFLFVFIILQINIIFNIFL